MTGANMTVNRHLSMTIETVHLNLLCELQFSHSCFHLGSMSIVYEYFFHVAIFSSGLGKGSNLCQQHVVYTEDLSQYDHIAFV